MPINPGHIGSFTFLDASAEKSSMTFNFGAITAASLPGFLTQFGALRTATDAISIGQLVGDMWTGDKTKYSNVVPTDKDAQRERKFLVVYEDDTTLALYRMEVPCADYALVDVFQGETDLVDLAQTAIAAFVTAFEALCRSPEGNAITVVSMRGVGRNT
ncbi:MAG: hypothetical protein KAR40_14335 [Candidatus Sabulitectum sp.]|nr:hypothetical protein [Candidatus Sabulitectum sp.]